MIEMSHTEEGVEEADLFTGEEENQPINDVSEKCNTALEILQNELMNCERSISLEKSVRKQNEEKFEPVIGLKEISNEITADYILNENRKSVDSDENFASNMKDIFSNDQYCELIENIIRVGNHFNEIEEDDVQKIIFEYAEVNEIGHGFDKTSRRTGNEWYQRFIRLHPQLNSVIKKSSNDCVQLDDADSSFSSRIVDKFLSDYKNIRKNETKIESKYKNPENEKYLDLASEYEQNLKPEQTISCQKGEQVYFSNTERSQSSCVVNNSETFNRNESATNAKHMYSNAETKNPGISCFPDTSNCVETGKTEKIFNPVSSVYSRNLCLVDECSNENILSESNEKSSNVTFENNIELAGNDGCDVVGMNLNNSITDDLSISDSTETPLEDSGVINNQPLIENCSAREDTSSSETSDNETTEEGSKGNENDITTAENLTNGSVIFSEMANSLSDLETSRLIDATSENLENTRSNDENSLLENNTTTFWDKCDENGVNNTATTPRPSDRTALKRKEPMSSINTDNEGDEKKPKISKKRRPSSLKKIKKSKYIYKLKSYSGSMLYFTSPTSVSFIKPVIKLTKVNESICNDLDDLTAAPNDTAPSDANLTDEMITNSDTGVEFNACVEAEQHSSAGCVLEKHAETEMNSNPGDNDPISPDEAETKGDSDNDFKELAKLENDLRSDNDLKGYVPPEINLSLDDLNGRVETETISNPNNELEEQSRVESQSIVEETKNENEDNSNPNIDDDMKKQVAKPSETTAEKKVNRLSNNYEKATPVSKTNTSDESITPTFGMKTRRKLLKFLPDGTLVTPNQRLQPFQEDRTSTSRSESKIAKKRSLKTSLQDTPKSEKKMKTVSTPAPSTPKQSNRSTMSTKKVSKNRPDRYIPKPNGQSKKPQKIFDYDSYYRENFRQTEVKLPPSCKKQMVALSKVTSISPSAQSGGPFSVNPAQLLSCLLGMPVTPDQIRTVRFKPPDKQRKPNKQINITPSKLASNDAIKPITKRHLELLQKTPFNIVPKTEIGVAKSTASTKSHSTAQ